jgi:hypothetical protein
MTILQKIRAAAVGLVLPASALIALGSASCAYRFTNTAMRAPLGVQSIAVEAIYDRSREIFPHEFLWSALQREIGRNGRLVLKSQDEADALMVVSITNARVGPVGTPTRESVSKDPAVTDTDKGDPNAFRNLRRAGSYTTDEGVSVSIHVDVFDLRNRALLFRRDYSQNASFKSLRPVTITPTSSAFPQYEEGIQAKAKEISNYLARSIVTDFLM